MIGANEGEVLSTADALWPLALLYLVSCGALGVGSLALLRHESKRAPAKDEEEEGHDEPVLLAGHGARMPLERDEVLIFFLGGRALALVAQQRQASDAQGAA